MTPRPDDDSDTSFPYPLRGRDTGQTATLLVDWIRNHSSYLTVGDLASKLGRVAAFAGGAAANWLLLLPWMLLFAYLIACSHFAILDHPLFSWVWLTGLIGLIVGGIMRTRGDDYAVERWRPTWLPTRILGCFVLSGGIAVLVVMVPHAVEWIRDFNRTERTNSLTAGGTLGAVVASLGAIQSLISGRLRWVLFAMQLLTAVAGIVLLLGTLLFLQNFVVYGNVFRIARWSPSSYLSPLNPVLGFAIASVGLLMVIGWAVLKRFQIFKRKPPFLTWTLGYQFACYVAMVALWFVAAWFIAGQEISLKMTDTESQLSRLREKTGQLTGTVSSLANIPNDTKLSDPTSYTLAELRRRYGEMSAFEEVLSDEKSEAELPLGNRDDWEVEYFDAAQSFIDLTAELGELKPPQSAELHLVLSQSNRPDGVSIADLSRLRSRMMQLSLWPKTHLFMLAGLLAILAGFFVDVNSNSMHGYYRNHLANAFFNSRPIPPGPSQDFAVGGDSEKPMTRILPRSEHDFQLTNLSPPGCPAPYLIVNAAMNLQAVKDPKLRDRKCDFWFFSKRYSGSERTGFIWTEVLEKVHCKMQLSTAMAISAASVSPNMGRRTNGFLVFMMALLNIRLGYWVPKPNVFEKRTIKDASGERRAVVREIVGVVGEELEHEVIPRWNAVYNDQTERVLRPESPTDLDHARLIGLALSGGGIRSASFALGVLQSLDRMGVFRHVDYLSTVSGGGYIGCGLSVSMASEHRRCRQHRLEPSLAQPQGSWEHEKPVFGRIDTQFRRRRLTATHYLREIVSNLHARKAWVNLSDGGHVENLAAFELLRRRCRLVIVSDAEADPDFTFNGLAALIRLAKIELDTTIEINVDAIRKRTKTVESDQRAEGSTQEPESHFAIGRILYPNASGSSQKNANVTGRLFYMKSSMTGDEELPVREYCDRHAAFPHQTTADQFFDQDQFDAYRLLGNHVCDEAFKQVFASGNVSDGAFFHFREFDALINSMFLSDAAESSDTT